MSVELCPSDRPGEVTIVTLKRFECIDVMDVDEVSNLFLANILFLTVSKMRIRIKGIKNADLGPDTFSYLVLADYYPRKNNMDPYS